MIISRERYLDDTSLHLVSLSLQTRTRDMHSVLADAPEDVRERLGDILATALEHVVTTLKPVLDGRPATSAPTTFGCGT
jgi:hypothetical protein